MQSETGDVEIGGDAATLYPDMLESPRRRWAFIRKVYAIILVQLLVTVGVAFAVILVKPMRRFVIFSTSKLEFAIYIVLLVLPLIIMCPLRAYYKRRPVNFVLLGLFTVTMVLGWGFTCAKEVIIFESAILTSVAVFALTLYTFWAVKRGRDFSFLGPFLFASLLVLIVFTLIQIFHPMEELSWTIIGCLGAIIFAAFVVYDTKSLIKRFSYDEYIWAAVSIYFDSINLFLNLLPVFRASDG